MFESLSSWLDACPRHQPLYAILSASSEAEPVRHYTEKDGRQPLWPLYADTSYAQWHPVMPYLVRLHRQSRFFEWITQTSSTDWGWLLTADVHESALAAHFRAFTQVLMPDGETVFFRYWETDYLRPIFHSLTEPTNSLIPPMQSCWLNGESFSFQPDTECSAKKNPWWQVSSSLLQQLEHTDNSPLIHNLMLFIQENRGDLWLSFPHETLMAKVQYFAEHFQGQPEQIAQMLCLQLTNELSL